jgi:cell division protein FtsI (penicillin-binding protein 3)
MNYEQRTLKSVRITIFFLVLVIGAFLALAGRCFYLQYFKNDYYVDACLIQQQGLVFLKPQRGVILDCRGRVLAASNKIHTIFAEPRAIKDPKTTSTELAGIVDMGAHEICKLIMDGKNPGFVKIKADADVNQCSAAGKIYGIGVWSDWLRLYPMGYLAAHVIGFTSADNRGLGGIELQYDKELHGSGAENIFLADVYRRPVRPKQQNGNLTDGVGIILTLDATIQEFARGALIKQYKDYQAESAIAIVAEPKSGAILALVSLPDFDPADARSTDPNNFLNRAITDEFEPGSIIKPIVAAIAVDAGVVNKVEKIFCENGSYSGKGFGRIGEYREGFGDLTVREILIHSSNIGMAKIGQRLGRDKLYEGLSIFGLGKKAGIDLPGEADGLLRPAGQWTGYSVTRVPFGQEISVTAIQLLRAFCILANGGCSVRPYLVKAMVGNDGQIIKVKPRRAGVGYVIKPEVARWIVTDAMVGVVNEGTGKRAKLDKWQVFGKTGTANIARSDQKGYSEDDYIASFVAGAPVEDPRIVVLVSIRKPNKRLGKGYTGGAVAAPVAAEIVEKSLTYLEKCQRGS